MKKILCIVCLICVLMCGCSAGENSAKISRDEAEKIALSDAGAAKDGVNRLKTKLDLDDDGRVYEVSFRTDEAEYDYEIDADTGEIVTSEKEKLKSPKKADSDNSQSAPAEGITEEEAKSAALKHAGVTQTDYCKIERDYDNGVEVYEIEFISNGIEYNYEVAVKTGEIIKFEKENAE